MERKIKKFLIFTLFFLGILFLPFQFIQAQGGFLGAILSIPINIISIFLQVFLLACHLIFSIANFILWWVTSPYFTSLPYTYGGIVDVGWPIVRDFTNMLFVIALVVIGLSTALRIKEYQFQKALPRLIIIAILINFTPVICGLIIDAANIFMNFFLEEVTGLKAMVDFLKPYYTALLELFSHRLVDIRYSTDLLAKTIAMIAFELVAAFIFFMYAILFIMRYIMIWVLVIVSPLAFFSRIFPGSQKYIFKSILGWEEWWKQFIEWSLIGIIGAFFLYLSEQLLILAPHMISAVPPDLWGGSSVGTTVTIEFINNLLPYGVVLAFLIIGFFTATSTSAMGAGAVTGWFKEQGMAIGKAAMFPLQRLGVRGIAGAAGILGKAGGLAGKGITGLGKGIEKIPILGKPFGIPLEMAGRGFEATAVAPLRRYAARARAVEIPKEFEEMTPEEQEEETKSQLIKGDKIKFAAKMADLGTLRKTSKEFQEEIDYDNKSMADNPHYKKEVDKIRKALLDKVTARLMIDFEADENAKNKMRVKIAQMANDLNISSDSAAKIILTSEMKSEDVPKIATKEFWKDEDIMHGIKHYWKGGQLRAAATKFEREFIEGFMNEIEADLEKIKTLPPAQAEIDFKAYVKANKARARYLETTAAQELGFGSMYEMAPNIIKTNYKSIKEILEE